MIVPLSFACLDWRRRLQDGNTPIPDLPLNEDYASVAVDLFNMLRIPDIPGTPTMGDAAGDWIRDIVRAVFGCVEIVPDENRPGKTKLIRRVGELFNLVPKKNGKTTNAGALGLVWMLLNKTPNVDGVIIGPTQEVADKCFAQIAAMIRLDPYLAKRFDVKEHKKTITDLDQDEDTGRPRMARLKVKSFDPKVVTGSIPAFAILDELHVMAEAHYASRVIGQIRGGMITNPASLLIFITTQSENRPSGAFEVELNYARKVRDGVLTEGVRMLPVLYEFPEEMQIAKTQPWRDPATWYMVTPSLGRPLDLDRMITDFRGACDKGRQNEIEWASQHLNIQVGMGYRGNAWAGTKYWDACANPGGLTLEQLLDQSEVCTVGGDWGGADDLASIVVMGRRPDRRYLHWSMTWARETVLEERKSIAETLRGFERMGELRIAQSPEEQAADAAELIQTVFSTGLLPEKLGIGFDPAQMDPLIRELELRDIRVPLVTGIPQTWALQPAHQGLALLLESKLVLHAGQEIMSWAAGNARQELKGNNYMVTKQAAGVSKIDPLFATFNAYWLMRLNPVAGAGALSPWDIDPDYRMAV